MTSNVNNDENSTIDDIGHDSSTRLLSREEPVLYKRRWLMLVILSLNEVICAQMSMSLNAVNTIASNYYNVQSTSIEWLSNMLFLMYVVLCVPITYMINRFGVRPTLLFVAFFDTVSNLLNYIGHDPSKFYFLIVGQIFNGIAYSCILQIPGKVSASWFQGKERATATSISMMSNIVGVALGFLQPSLMIKSGVSTGADIKMFFLMLMIETIIIFILTFLYEETPPTPPFVSTATREEIMFKDSFWMLVKNKDYILLSITYGLMFGLSLIVSVLLNPLATPFFPKETTGIGMMGFWNYAIAVISFVVVGRMLDRYSNYKMTAAILTGGSCTLWITFVLILTLSDTFSAAYAIFVLLGLFMQSFQSAGIEQAAEITYPVSEEISTVFMVMLTCGFGFVGILVLGFIIQAGYVQSVASVIGALYFIAFLLTLCTKTELKRLQAEANSPGLLID